MRQTTEICERTPHIKDFQNLYSAARLNVIRCMSRFEQERGEVPDAIKSVVALGYLVMALKECNLKVLADYQSQQEFLIIMRTLAGADPNKIVQHPLLQNYWKVGHSVLGRVFSIISRSPVEQYRRIVNTRNVTEFVMLWHKWTNEELLSWK